MNARANAGRNPAAVYRDPMTMDDYLDARMITTPFGLYDCDVPCDGSVAIVVSARRDRRRHAPGSRCSSTRSGPRSRSDGRGTRARSRTSRWCSARPRTCGRARRCSRRRRRRAALRRVHLQLPVVARGARLLRHRRGAAFLGDGSRIALDGELPLNPHGGQLSAGRTTGSASSTRPSCSCAATGERQVAGAQVGVVSTGGGTRAAASSSRSDRPSWAISPSPRLCTPLREQIVISKRTLRLGAWPCRATRRNSSSRRPSGCSRGRRDRRRLARGDHPEAVCTTRRRDLDDTYFGGREELLEAIVDADRVEVAPPPGQLLDGLVVTGDTTSEALVRALIEAGRQARRRAGRAVLSIQASDTCARPVAGRASRRPPRAGSSGCWGRAKRRRPGRPARQRVRSVAHVRRTRPRRRLWKAAKFRSWRLAGSSRVRRPTGRGRGARAFGGSSSRPRSRRKEARTRDMTRKVLFMAIAMVGATAGCAERAGRRRSPSTRRRTRRRRRARRVVARRADRWRRPAAVRHFRFGGRDRTYLLSVPPGDDGTGP